MQKKNQLHKTNSIIKINFQTNLEQNSTFKPSYTQKLRKKKKRKSFKSHPLLSRISTDRIIAQRYISISLERIVSFRLHGPTSSPSPIPKYDLRRNKSRPTIAG